MVYEDRPGKHLPTNVKNFDENTRMIINNDEQNIKNEDTMIRIKKSSFHQWKLGTVNIRTGNEKSEGAKMYAITKEVARAELSICFLQEVRYRNNGTRRISLDTGEEYDFFWSGPKRRRDAGVAILIKVDKDITASEPDYQDPRVISMNVTVQGFKLRLVNVYSPTNTDGSVFQKDDFYRKVRKACILTEKKHKLIVAGDFNAITSVVLKNSFYDGSGIIEDTQCNDNGTRLKTFCRSQRLSMLQTYFDIPLEERYTWHSNDGATTRVLDYVLSEKFVQQYVTDCVVEDKYEFESDHRLVVTSLLTPKSKSARWKPKSQRERQRDISALKIIEQHDKFVQTVANHMPISHEGVTAEQRSEDIVEALKHSASLSLPPKSAKRTREIWKDDRALNNALNERSTLARGSIQYKEISKKIKKRVYHLRNEKLKTEAEEINQFYNKRQIENLFKAFKYGNQTFKTPFKSTKCDPNKLQNYFHDHFRNKSNSIEPDELKDIPYYIDKLKSIEHASINTDPPSLEELAETVKRLKNGKASNDIPAEFLKHASSNNDFMLELTQLYKDVWENTQIPISWGHSRLVALWKGPSKGKADNPATYRGLQIGSSLCKLMVIIIINRIKEWYEKQLLDQQQGFRAGRGTTDGLFLVKSLQQIAHKTNKTMYVLFIDLTAAFDHIERKWLFKTIKQRLKNDANHKLFDLLEALYSSTTTALDKQDKFNIELGVRQGGAESPLLFNLFIDYVMRVVHQECEQQNVKFIKLKYSIPSSASEKKDLLGMYGDYVFDWAGYADDLILAFDDKTSMDKGLQIINKVFKRFQLAINASKTKTMIFNYAEPPEQYPTSIAKLDGEMIENVKTFQYLGSQIKFDQPTTGDTELTSRIDMAENKFHEHSRKLLNHKIKLSTRMVILNALVRSRLTYGCQTWTLNSRQTDRMNSAYTTMLRKMVRGGYQRKENEWGYKMTNKDLIDLCKTECIQSFTLRQKQRYLAHVIRLPDHSIVKRTVFNADVTARSGRQTTYIKSALAGSNLHQFAQDALMKRI